MTEVQKLNQIKVGAMYAAVYNRAPDQAGLNFWTHELNSGKSFLEMANLFVAHPVFARDYDHLSTRGLVENIYINVLGSSGDREGIDHWTKGLENGLSIGEFLSEFLEASISYNGNNYGGKQRKEALLNRIEVGLDYVEKMGAKNNFAPEDDIASASILANPIAAMAADAITNVTHQQSTVLSALKQNNITAGLQPWIEPNVNVKFGDKTLTHRADDIFGTASYDRFIAEPTDSMDRKVQLLNTGDYIDGGEGVDSLYAHLTGRQWNASEQRLDYTNVTKPNLTSVENVYVNANAIGQILDLTSSTGINFISIGGGYNYGYWDAKSGISVLGVKNANVEIYRIEDKAPIYLGGVSGKSFALSFNSSGKKNIPVTVNIDLDHSGAAIQTDTMTLEASYSHAIINGNISSVKNLSIKDGYSLKLTELHMDSLEVLSVNNSSQVSIVGAMLPNLDTINLSNEAGLTFDNVIATNLSTININDNSYYSSKTYKIDLNGAQVGSAVKINLDKTKNLFYDSEAQQSAETFIITNKDFNAIEIKNFDLAGAVQDKLDLSAFSIASINQLNIYAGRSDDDANDIIIRAKSGQFDGGIKLAGAYVEGMDINAALADSFIFA